MSSSDAPSKNTSIETCSARSVSEMYGRKRRPVDDDSAADGSSQIKNPITVGGRILDVFMEIYAITVIAGLAGAIGSFLQKRGQEIDEIR
jgi:hypothetical protein